MKHIHGFDALRAFAVLGVMFYHLGWAPFGFGWVGVPFFFVLSGFLITGILLDNREAESGSYFTTFYVRRCLRIFPLYFLYLAVIALWCVLMGVPTTGWTYFVLYLQNYWMGANEFQLIPGMELGHTWSLAVEEQFYMLWPLVVFFASKQQLKILSIALIAICVVSRYWLLHNTQFVPFASLTSNFDTLCLGALLAILARESKTRLRSFSGVALVLGAITIAMFSLDPSVSLNASHTFFMFGLALLFAGIVGIVASDLGFALGWKPLAYIGRISYGLYIWHAFGFHIISAAIYHKLMPDYGAPTMDTLRLLITFAVAMASFHWFELPILRLKDRFKYRPAATRQTREVLSQS